MPLEKVFETVLEVLEDEGYYVEADAESGRINAEPEAAAAGRKPVLAVRVAAKGNRTVVDVQTRAGANPGQMVSLRTDTAVLELLHALDRRLQGMGGRP